MHIRTKPTQAINDRPLPSDSKYVDLGSYYNFALSEEIHGKPGNTISIPPGINDFNGVKFDVRGIIQLASSVSFEKSHIRYPEKITGIPVNNFAESLCFLHSSAWNSKSGSEVVEIIVHYANLQQLSIKIRYREDVEDWWFDQNNSVIPVNALLAWEGINERVKALGLVLKLYRYSWANPNPGIEVRSIDLISVMNETGYMLYGITCL